MAIDTNFGGDVRADGGGSGGVRKLELLLWTAAVLATGAALFYVVAGGAGAGHRRALGKLLFVAWTIGPPAWFLIRYRFWPPAPGQTESFRIEQGLARSVWAGILVLMAVIFFGHW
jgi:hypothetical protein